MNRLRMPPSVSRRAFLLEMLPRHSVGMEIGVHLGDFSAAIMDIVEPEVLHLVDPWLHEPSETYAEAWYGRLAQGQAEMDQRYATVVSRFEGEIARGQVEVHRGTSRATLQGFADGSLDWVYVDGNHLYDFVRVDLELSLLKTKPDGCVAGDDYADGGWWNGGVKRAVDELAAGGGVQVEILGGQYLIRRSPAT